MPKIRVVVCRATAGGAVPAVLLSSSLDVLQPSAMLERSPFLLQSDDDMFFSDRSARDVITFFLFGLLRCPTQSSLNCLHQDSVSITYKMIRQLQLCLVWLVCSGR